MYTYRSRISREWLDYSSKIRSPNYETLGKQHYGSRSLSWLSLCLSEDDGSFGIDNVYGDAEADESEFSSALPAMRILATDRSSWIIRAISLSSEM